VSEETFEQVSNVRGHVDIKPGEDEIIHITAIKHKGSGLNGNTQIIIEQEEDGLVVAEARYDKSVTNWFGLNKPSQVDFTIQVPKACSVKVNCVSSSAVVEGLEGDIDINCVSGDLELSDLNGKFNFSSVSGKIIANNLTGPMEMNNVSGKVQITESQIPMMSGKTVSGNVSVETPLTEGPYEFKSVSGNLILITPDDTACTIRTKSVSGTAKVNLPVTSKSGTRNKRLIEVAGGGPEVLVNSVSGVLKIGSPNYVKPEEPAEVATTVEPAHPPKSQMEILREIENGEITVDEALKRLNP